MFTQEQLMEMIEQESKELGGDQIELWILEVDGKKRLPAFSSKEGGGILVQDVAGLEQGVLVGLF